MTKPRTPRGKKEPPLTKTRGRGVRFCCPRDDCPKCFRSVYARSGHMGTAHGARQYERSEIEHGTVSGYNKERNRGLDTCLACRVAYTRARRLEVTNKRTVNTSESEAPALVFVEGEWLDSSDISSE